MVLPPPPPPQASSLAARVAELESEVDAARSEARSFGSMAASKERDAHRRLEGLQDELEHAHEQVCVWWGGGRWGAGAATNEWEGI
jgi:hypothetical protein